MKSRTEQTRIGVSFLTQAKERSGLVDFLEIDPWRLRLNLDDSHNGDFRTHQQLWPFTPYLASIHNAVGRIVSSLICVLGWSTFFHHGKLDFSMKSCSDDPTVVWRRADTSDVFLLKQSSIQRGEFDPSARLMANSDEVSKHTHYLGINISNLPHLEPRSTKRQTIVLSSTRS